MVTSFALGHRTRERRGTTVSLPINTGATKQGAGGLTLPILGAIERLSQRDEALAETGNMRAKCR